MTDNRKKGVRAAFSRMVQAGRARLKKHAHLSIYAEDADEMSDDEESNLLEDIQLHPERTNSYDATKKWRQLPLNEIQTVINELEDRQNVRVVFPYGIFLRLASNSNAFDCELLVGVFSIIMFLSLERNIFFLSPTTKNLISNISPCSKKYVY